MMRRLAERVIWFFGGMSALVLIAYAILFLVNLEDRQPTAEIAVLKSLQNPTAPVVNDNNSYLYMLGFSGPPDADPMVLGLKRYEWMEITRPEFGDANDPLKDDYDFGLTHGEWVASLKNTCSQSPALCLQLLESDNATMQSWLSDERWLLERYRTLTAMTGFREALPFEMLAPLPSYGVISEGQHLMIADAWQSATAGDAQAVRHSLERDLTYWRMVLENSDALITKMIATAAVIRHFKLGNLVLRRLPEASRSAGIPSSWQTEITNAERSMKRSLAGEWTFFDATIKKDLAHASFGDWTTITDATTLERLTWFALKPFLQPQDLSNGYARLMLDLGKAFDVAYGEMPCAVGLADERQESAYRPFNDFYNFVGELAMSAHSWTFSEYAVRVSDLEGIRRAALLVAELRSEGVATEDVSQRMLHSDIVDPYTNHPFIWRDSSASIVFNGLEPHERSQHEIIY